eukprot:gnl/TRDRNA2_/TRDRNA2_38922_c0_seq1.p1 gnl/TRDRNA2_/TRDRNA2_38922_c0~~gnl/TRDRNA2_/TRDRNA2_38922_c0_seq1.p1  ORF type:complete len:583 (+),score=117.09 gnl/TRDRNA2_/TRDRNA2_38922_c0_seq1:89-1837(+)
MINYEEEWLFSLLFQIQGSVAIRASSFAAPAAIVALFLLFMDDWAPSFRENVGILGVRGSQVYTASTAMIVVLIAFRTKQALSRFWEGTGLLHMMRGEWFDTVSNCVTFSISAKATKPKEVQEFRHCLVRLMSLCHGSALEEIADNQIQLETIDTFGLDAGTLRHLMECHEVYHFNKVEVMLHLVQSLITKAHDDGVLKIPPPILSRVYQTISRGFVNLLNSKKITDTKFPFPYAQLISFLLFAHVILTPLMMSVLIPGKVLCALFTFVPIFGMFSLNLIASELENPFGTDANDLPLGHFQAEMNNCLLMLLHTNTDLIASVSSKCIMDFNKLVNMVEISRAGHVVKPAPGPGNAEGYESRQTRLSRLSQFVLELEKDEAAAKGEGFRGSVIVPEVEDGSQPAAAPEARASGPARALLPAIAPPASQAVQAPSPAPAAASSSNPEPKAPPAPPAPPAAATSQAETVATQQMIAIVAKDVAEAVQKAEERSSLLIDPIPRDKPTINEANTAELQFLLAKGMGEFNLALQRWTKKVDDQVSELNGNFDTLKHFSDSLPSLLLSNNSKVFADHDLQSWEAAVCPM